MQLVNHPDYVTLNDLTVAKAHLELLHAHNLTTLEQLMTTNLAQPMNKPGLPEWRDRSKLELIDTHGQTHTLFLKRYRNPPPREQRNRIAQGHPHHGTAWHEWMWMSRLADKKIPAVKPIAYGQQVESRRETASAILTAAVPGISLETWAATHTSPAPREWIDQVADLVADLHAHGFYHRDLYICHIFVDESAAPTDRFHLIDLQRMIEPRFFKTRWLVKDLAALNYSTPSHTATRVARVRFVRRHLRIPRLNRPAKSLIRKIAAKTARIARHDQRRNARLASESRP